jgi:hypothetical protein
MAAKAIVFTRNGQSDCEPTIMLVRLPQHVLALWSFDRGFPIVVSLDPNAKLLDRLFLPNSLKIMV